VGLAVLVAAGLTARIAGQEAGPAKSNGKPAVVIQRRDKLTKVDLRKQLLQVPEVDLDQDQERNTSAWMMELAAKSDAEQHFQRTRLLRHERPDLTGLPLRMGADCRLTKKAAGDLASCSRELRIYANDLGRLCQELLGGDSPDGQAWLQPKAVPALNQMLQAEAEAARMLLVEVLARISGRASSTALAQRAVFDVSPEVRAAAVQALAGRRRAEYRVVLMDGLRYPWAAAADHAAEALVALRDRDAVPLLAALSREANPTVVIDPARGPGPTARELVRINHLRNCLLCHAGSRQPNDPVRGRVPQPSEPLPPTFSPAYYDGDGLFVRADITYLRQDFSVRQPVESPGHWPGVQRYDYLVRTRPARRADLDPVRGARHREAILFALRELDGNGKALALR
jgi:hypothetical protein